MSRLSTFIVAGLLLVAGYSLVFGIPYRPMTIELSPRPIMAMRIVGSEGDARAFANDPSMMHGHTILQRRIIEDPQLQTDLLHALKSGFTYGGQGAKCFDPGIAIRFGDGQGAVDALICLGCGYVHFYRNGQASVYTLSNTGKKRIGALYSRLFPGHSLEVEDEDSTRARDARSKEWDRRQQATDASTAPSTLPG